MKLIYLKTQDDRLSFINSPCSKQAFLIIFALVIQNIAVTVGMHSSDYLGNETDHTALLAIKSQLTDQPHGVLSSWNNFVHHCKWTGVICGHKHSRVIVLDLRSRGLAGTISPFIGNLSFLKTIRVYNNSLYGQIPKQLTYLIKLNELNLGNNTLTGHIPANISRCVNLIIFYVSGNKLEGQLPVGLRALSKLKVLSVFKNNLRGPLFDVLRNLTSLVTISTRENSFTGTIPNSIGRMQNLTYLGLANNQISGTLPTSLFNISSLQSLDLVYNQLHGELPPQMGFTTLHLKWLGLGANKFSGSIPNSVRNLTSLMVFDLSKNGFTGRVPQDFGHFHNLTRLLLYQNKLVGDINFISTLVNCTQLSCIQVEDNDFTGMIPDSMANLSTTLTSLTMGNNSISGALPATITNLINLESLVMNNIKLTGFLPCDFGKLQKLQEVDFSSNRLTGIIPNSVGNLSRLCRLNLRDNILEGSIPQGIGKCQSLQWLDLKINHLSGNIPSDLFEGAAIFIWVSLSFNHLEGSLPFEISKQINLIVLGVSNNKLSGVIPDVLSYCTALQYLYLGGNLFHGHIPPSLASLSSLLLMDVSHNQLSGQIPAYLSKFPLTYLNLSYNNFEGKVPTTGVFANVSVVFLDGNKKLCGGIQALYLPTCVEKNMELKKKSMGYALKKMVISSICVLVGVLAMSIGLYLLCKRNKSRLISSTPMTRKTFTKVSYNMLLKATSGFSSENLLGRGSFGSVFKGILDGKMVAVKVLNSQRRGASKSFIAECKALREARHRNLVGIVTICSSIDFQRNEFRALVYEFMYNGSLDRWLKAAEGNMSLAQRVDVAIDVAHALNYLHQECEMPIVHCDLKPSNILLDNDMVARVRDFGLSKFLNQTRHPNQSSTIGIRGTIGYAAPEYGLGSEPSTDGDVYSYGILLLELMTGKSPTDDMFKEDYNLHMYAEEVLPYQVLQVIDPSLEGDIVTLESNDRRVRQDALHRMEECIITVVTVGVSCSNHSPQNRMKISDAISRLQSARDNLLNAKRRPNLPAREV